MFGAALLVGAGLSTTTAVIAAEPASAVTAISNGALVCDQNTLYAIDSTGKVVAVDITTGASKGTTADVTNLGTGANNGLGISREGVSMFAASNNVSATLRQYDPKDATSLRTRSPTDQKRDRDPRCGEPEGRHLLLRRQRRLARCLRPGDEHVPRPGRPDQRPEVRQR